VLVQNAGNMGKLRTVSGLYNIARHEVMARMTVWPTMPAAKVDLGILTVPGVSKSAANFDRKFSEKSPSPAASAALAACQADAQLVSHSGGSNVSQTLTGLQTKASARHETVCRETILLANLTEGANADCWTNR